MSQPLKVPPQTLSIDEVCSQIGISRALLYRLMRENAAPKSIKIGRRRLFTVEAIAAWLDAMQARHD